MYSAPFIAISLFLYLTFYILRKLKFIYSLNWKVPIELNKRKRNPAAYLSINFIIYVLRIPSSEIISHYCYGGLAFPIKIHCCMEINSIESGIISYSLPPKEF